jgi:hypothetical protein
MNFLKLYTLPPKNVGKIKKNKSVNFVDALKVRFIWLTVYIFAKPCIAGHEHDFIYNNSI